MRRVRPLRRRQRVSSQERDPGRLKKIAFLLSVFLAGSAPSSANTNPLFGYTHILPSPFTLPAGSIAVGTSFALGITDWFMLGTNLVYDVNQIYNVNARLALVDTEEFALSLTGGFQAYNYRNISLTNPDTNVTSWQPGVVFAYALDPDFACFNGVSVNFSQIQLVTAGIQRSGYVRGTSLGMDCSWAYNSGSKKGGIGNALSFGSSYDMSYSIFGIGLSHHWPGFQLGVHYYPNADQNQWLPIIGAGFATSF